MEYTLGSIGDLISGAPTKKKNKNSAPVEIGAPIDENAKQSPKKKKNSIGKSDLLNIMQSIQSKGKKNSISEDGPVTPNPQGKKNKNSPKNLVSLQGKTKNSVSEGNIENKSPQGKKRNKKNSVSENNVPQNPKKKNKKNSISEDDSPENGFKEESDAEIPSTTGKIQIKKEQIKKEPQDEEPEESEDSEGSDDSDAAPETQKKKGKLTNAELRIKGKESKEKQKKTEELRAGTKDQTIFVGNVSVKVTKKKLLKYFAKYGTVESLRFRSIPIADTRTPKKVAAIKKEFHAERTSLNAYIQFSTRDSAVNAVAENGKLFEGTHIRVDLCTKELKHDDTKAIFIGNLSFTAEDEALWELFESCGEIESVRIVRDGRTNVGKGFGYVNFVSSDSVALALQLEKPKLNDRELRISPCDNKKNKKQRKKVERVNKKQDQPGDNKENGGGGMVEKKKSFPPRKQFQGSKFAEKKKKNKFNKGDMKKKNMAKKFVPKEKV